MNVTNLRTGDTYRIEEEAVLGRQSDCDIVVSDTRASRQHARIYLSEGKYFVEDLGSRNGTSLNDQALTEPREIRAGPTPTAPMVAPAPAAVSSRAATA